MKLQTIVSMLTPFGGTRDDKRDDARRADYRAVFSTTRGRRVLADILNEGVLMRAHIAFDAHRLAILEGRRSLALDIFDLAGGARARIGEAMARDDIGEALDEPDATAGNAGRPDKSAAREPDPGADGDPLFADPGPTGPILGDGD